MEEALIVAVCLVLNGLLAAFEMAFVTVQRSELRSLARQGSRPATYLLRLRENPERTLSILQVGITLVGALAAAVGGVGVLESLAPHLMQEYGISEFVAETIGIVVFVVPLTYLSVVIGELVPKALALRSPLKILLRGARPIQLSDRLFGPVVTILESSTQLLIRIFFPQSRPIDNSESESVEVGHLSPAHQQFVLNMVDIEARKIRDIMIPWRQVDHVLTVSQPEEVTSAVMLSGHTRLPVIGDGKVLGILHTKEYMALKDSGERNWLQIVRPCIFVKPSDSALGVLRQMQERRSHMAVVGNFSEPIGVVTLEDIIEEIVGDIYDEDDDGRVRKVFASSIKARTHIAKPTRS